MTIDQFIKSGDKRLAKQSEIAEVDIEEHYCKHAKKRKCLALKLTLLNLRSFPDRTTLCPGGRILFIEFKRKGKEQTEGQKKKQILLESFGFKYYVCDTIGQAEKYLDEFLNNV